jgi:prevent-host-death family protein
MKTISAREANQNFSRILAEVEAGETVLIAKHGRTVAELRPTSSDRRDDPAWRAAFEHMIELMDQTPETGFRIGKITLQDNYGDVA